MPTKKSIKTEEVAETAEATADAEISEIYDTAVEPEFPVVSSPWENKVMLTVAPPMSKAEEKDVIIYINGRNWIMPKGGTYEVPKPVADEYYRSLKARAHGMKRKGDMVRKEQKINAYADAVINGKA